MESWANLLYIVWLLHQTTTLEAYIAKMKSCISFDSYIKPQPDVWYQPHQQVVYLLTPTSNHNFRSERAAPSPLYIFWLLHQTTTERPPFPRLDGLYIFWLLHQTTTASRSRPNPKSCISFDSYIKPQPKDKVEYSSGSCISFDSYIKPQLSHLDPATKEVVYLLTPTSNHNLSDRKSTLGLLYIFWLLHQTTTEKMMEHFNVSCISFDSYIKPQPCSSRHSTQRRCISFDSYIKPQLMSGKWLSWQSCISFDSYIKPQLFSYTSGRNLVVYLLTPTSNHNLAP